MCVDFCVREINIVLGWPINEYNLYNFIYGKKKYKKYKMI